MGRIFVFALVVLVSVSGAAVAFGDGTTTDLVVDYTAGAISSALLQKSGVAAVGLPVAVDDGQTTPFSPPFHATSIVVVGAGGQITLHFAEPVISTGRDIGVFTNTGLAAASAGGVTVAGAGTLGQADTAIVSVSNDDVNWFMLNGGNALDLTMVSNAFTDSVLGSSGGIVGVGGVTASDPYEPFLGTVGSFAGESYPEIVSTLNGSWGGAWVDASGAGFAINFIRFDVPTGDRLVLDGVTAETAVPEGGTVGVFALSFGILAVRGRRVR